MQSIQSIQSKQPKQSKQSKKSQGINDNHSRNYEFKDESNYSSNNKMYNLGSSQISNISVRRRSNGLDYDKNNDGHSDVGVTIGIND